MLSGVIMPHMLGCVHAFKLREQMHDHFRTLTSAKERHLRTELSATTLESGTFEEYLLRFKAIVDSLASVGDLVPSQQHIDVFLEGLPEDYGHVISIIESKFEMMQLEEVEALLHAHEMHDDNFKKKA